MQGAGSLALLGPQTISGFPAVWAQAPKVLRYLGTAVNQSPDIAKKVKEDTGISLEYIPVTTDDVSRRVITQPNSYDIVDTEYFSLRKLVPSGNMLAMDGKKIKNFDKITPVFSKGELPSGKKIGDQGTAPKKVMFLEGQNSTKFAKTPTQWATEVTVRSPQSNEYGKVGMSLMWMPAQTTRPPLRVAASAAGTSAPTGAKS